MSVRALVKAVAERGTVWSGAPLVSRRRRRGQTLVLAYHNVVPDGARPTGDRSLHLPQRAFAKQLDRLAATHEVVSLHDALRNAFRDALAAGGAAGRTATRGKPRAVITFDDAYTGALTAGLAELRRRSLPATVFVAPGRLGGEAFWWDRLAPAGSPGLAPEVRAYALRAARGRENEVVRWAGERGLPMDTPPAYATSADEETLRTALAYPGLSLGAHTWSHPNLTCLTEGELRAEMESPLQWLSRFGDRAVPVIAYPYGLADGAVHRAAERAGYEAGFMIDGGWVSGAEPSRYALPRLNVPAGVSEHGFALRVSGLIAS